MDYLSAKQMAARWKVSPRRVALLAAQGRIPGAELSCGRWIIPERAEKPADPRKMRSAPRQGPPGRYIFPFPLGIVRSEAQLQSFTLEEAELYRLCLLYEEGRFSEARTLAERLLRSPNRYIRLGALYLLTTVCVILADYPAADKYSVLFHAECQDERAHREEINLLRTELEVEMSNGYSMIKHMGFSDQSAYPDELLGLVGICEMFADFAKLAAKGSVPNIAAYETMCRMTEAQGYFYCALIMHMYLSSFYAAVQNVEKEDFHFKAAIDIGLKHGIFFTLSYYMLHNAEAGDRFLGSYPPAVVRRIQSLSEVLISGWKGYAEHKGRATALAQLNDEDYRLVSCCLKGYSNEEMAQTFCMSDSGMNKRLANLYRKLGVKSKHDMVRVYLRSSLGWDGE